MITLQEIKRDDAKYEMNTVPKFYSQNILLTYKSTEEMQWKKEMKIGKYEQEQEKLKRLKAEVKICENCIENPNIL